MQIFYVENLYIFEVLLSVFQDLIGRPCLTTHCVTEANELSLIKQIDIIDENGHLKTSIV
jgi:hypothetical protein